MGLLEAGGWRLERHTGGKKAPAGGASSETGNPATASISFFLHPKMIAGALDQPIGPSEVRGKQQQQSQCDVIYYIEVMVR
jgi:hypothetical protein